MTFLIHFQAAYGPCTFFFVKSGEKSFHAWLAFGEPRLAKSEPVYLKQWATKKNHFQHKQENSHLQIATEKEKTTEHG